jgi:hypothetical protein
MASGNKLQKRKKAGAASVLRRLIPGIGQIY